MTSIAAAAEAFLACRRIAVTGVSRNPQVHAANGVYLRLKERGYDVFPVNPNTAVVEGDVCYPTLSAIPGGVQGVVIGTRPEHAMAAVEEAIALGVANVWMHRAFGPGSVDDAAAARGREAGLTVIDGGCPLMFGETSDGGHRFMCKMLTLTGKVPRTV